NRIIANNQLLVDAASRKAEELGFHPTILGTEIDGEAKDTALVFARLAGDLSNSRACVLAAGETTVTVRGNGLGGRNQEMALVWAISMASKTVTPICCFACVASDGTDGPTDAAGGLVDPSTCARAVGKGLNPSEFLNNNDSYHLLEATGDLIV